MGKIIFLDIDGTIRWFDGSVPDSTIYAIREARKRGHEVCVCSGRPLSLIEKSILDIGFDGIVSCTGTYVVYRGKCVQRVSFDPRTVHELCEYLVDKDCMIELQRYDQTFLLKRFVNRYEEMGRNMMKSLGEGAKELEPYPALAEQDTDVENVEKVMFFSRKVPYDEIYSEWSDRVVMTPFSIPNAERWGGEISPLNVNKTSGIRSVLEHSSYSREDVIAIGDSDNDADMLEFAATGVAMGNATENARRAADWQTAPLLEDGILKAFRKLELI
ncbi:MAG: Cof-type HAD-IIB family hydrolase [Blautia sp.]|nr:Cof-type HAD-IIB family hydrolase [Blautia sp.]MDY3998392.1 Cof-type HAD-IIB family hydrolase [Blautia sp.]